MRLKNDKDDYEENEAHAEFPPIGEFREKIAKEMAEEEAKREAELIASLPSLEELHAQIEELRLKLSSLQPEVREGASTRFLMVMSEYALKSKEKTRTILGKIVDQFKRPFVAIKKAAQPLIVRHSFRMKVERSGCKNGSYEVIIRYEPSSLGRLLKRDDVRQGYRRTHDNAWEPFPRRRDEGPVSGSMTNFLEKRYISDSLNEAIRIVEKIRLNPLDKE